jgi:bifunctional non-homologous end joining protein LigD
VVQQHRARREHFDFRLEWQGVLLSWAVPKGPSLDPAEKRLAVHVEDHPVDYADFEGVIPEGNYGAGAVIVWDIGRWFALSDPASGLESGKLDFELAGYKLRGRYTLVRTRGKERAKEASREWLLIKKRDAFAGPDAFSPRSVFSGLTIEELEAGPPREAALLRRIARLGAPRREVRTTDVELMLAEPATEPFTAPGWLFEIKYDGWRVLAAREKGRALVRTRGGRDATALFPELAAALRSLPCEHAILDGELVVLDAKGRPSFGSLQQRAQAGDARGAARADVELPATFFAFDLVAFGDHDLRPLPLHARRSLLAELVPEPGPVRVADAFPEQGERVYEEASRLGLEGVVAKRADAPYRAGRGPAWRKIPLRRTGDFAVVGYRAGRGARAPLGALHLAARDGSGLRYVGRVGSGLDDRAVRTLRAELEPLQRDTAPCEGAPATTREDRWVEPRVVVEARYSEMTRDGRLRQPVFVRRRDDKGVDAADPVPSPGREPAEPSEVPVEPPKRSAGRGVAFTNLEKIFWPEEGLTKGDLIDYYRSIAPWILPYLKDRPLVMVRHPDGIEGKSFFQKDAPAWAPEWVRRETLWSEHGGREIRYFVCDDVESLLFVANLGAIPLHVWSSRVTSLARPEWSILDLDPKGAPFLHVVRVAQRLRAVSEAIGLPTFVKTSGSAGLHVLVPLGAQLTFEQSRVLADLLARTVVAELSDIATLARRLAARGGRVYVDTGQNGHGKLLVAPFSVRALPGAPVSMPLRWSEVTPRLDPVRFTIRHAVTRMRRLESDPLAPVLSESPDLLAALERLRARVAGAQD